jgi:hypothetical protein
VVSFSRAALQQTGGGHFSPVRPARVESRHTHQQPKRHTKTDAAGASYSGANKERRPLWAFIVLFFFFPCGRRFIGAGLGWRNLNQSSFPYSRARVCILF